MKLGIVVLCGELYFLCRGFLDAHYFALGYVWLSFLYPQGFVPDPVRSLPFPLVFAGLGLAGCLAGSRRIPRITFVTALLAAFALWITCSTFLWAELPYPAQLKWNWAIKSVGLAVFMPLLFRTRVAIESAVLTMFFALFAHIATAGIKALWGGGGYGSFATLIRDNSYLGESSTLATVIVLSLPLAAYVALDSLCAAGIPLRRVALLAYSGLAVSAMVGTSARTGLIALMACLATVGKRLWQKAAVCASCAVIAIVSLPFLPASWTGRMQTIGTYGEDESAAGRVAVWKWSLRYVAGHPLGGGFDIYRTNQLLTLPDGERAGKAFHSIYFEILGEQGVVGLGLYGIASGAMLIGLHRLQHGRESRPIWIAALSRRLFAACIIFFAGGAFIGVAYQPIGYALFGLYACVKQAARETRAAEEPAPFPEALYAR